jgi:hypothetical protein
MRPCRICPTCLRAVAIQANGTFYQHRDRSRKDSAGFNVACDWSGLEPPEGDDPIPGLRRTTNGQLREENTRLRAQLAALGEHTTEWGVEWPGEEPQEHCGFTIERLRAIAAGERDRPGWIVARTTYRGTWHRADDGEVPSCSSRAHRDSAGDVRVPCELPADHEMHRSGAKEWTP